VVHLAARSQSLWSLALQVLIKTLAYEISAGIVEDDVTSPPEDAREQSTEDNIVSIKEVTGGQDSMNPYNLYYASTTFLAAE
jgi:hypothetical protein